MDLYVEIGKKRAFATALGWPGWGRNGLGEEDALQALFSYGPRYARAIQPAGLGFDPPKTIAELVVLKRFEGDATTDFGGFSVITAEDTQVVSDENLRRYQSLLQACWLALEKAAGAAAGKELQKGPRGGGRELDGILRHVIESQAAYLGRIGVKFKTDPQRALIEELHRCGQTILEGLAACAHGELPAQGPRGGVYWPARYFVRKVAWHVLDHTWEIEDRIL